MKKKTTATRTTSPERSRIMRAVKGKNTGLELMVRRLIHSAGYRYRLHEGTLPGTPDLVFPGRRAAVFVNGCFWHGHRCKRGNRLPATNTAYWMAKIARNKSRDKAASAALKLQGWAVLTVWECQTKDAQWLMRRISAFLARETAP